ncbi:hypothetical protein GALMADRAFT_276017 [Galerina marginata CBS 339.88]|uniref:Uncharacterized protein n=1 Tax=Galerina marginata (strain CBS 339.88) TaxID=685588 RepID=A0A067TIP4_GALM3|nr:hypothetical protein GALMADRAFT_276017 [Galerina marginata CBS 339.88]
MMDRGDTARIPSTTTDLSHVNLCTCYEVDTVYPLLQNPNPSICKIILNNEDQARLISPPIGERSSDELILKPSGQVGSPGRGGYNLQAVLKWDPAMYKIVQKFIQARIRYYTEQRTLFRGLTITKQPPIAISIIQEEARHKFEILSRYDENWPSRDMIATFLGNASHGNIK